MLFTVGMEDYGAAIRVPQATAQRNQVSVLSSLMLVPAQTCPHLPSGPALQAVKSCQDCRAAPASGFSVCACMLPTAQPACSAGSVPHPGLAKPAAVQGYYEDRRPASNMDPYLVTGMLVSTTLGIPIPGAPSGGSKGQTPQECSGETSGTTSCSSGVASRSSSALIDDIDKRGSFSGPGTPDGVPALAAALCYSSSGHSHNGC